MNKYWIFFCLFLYVANDALIWRVHDWYDDKADLAALERQEKTNHEAQTKTEQLVGASDASLDQLADAANALKEKWNAAPKSDACKLDAPSVSLLRATADAARRPAQ